MIKVTGLFIGFAVLLGCGRLPKAAAERGEIEITGGASGTPVRIEGHLLTVRPERKLVDQVRRMMEQDKALFKLKKPKTEFKVLSDETDELGFRHLKLQRVHRGVPVWGEELMFHVNKENRLFLYQGHYSPSFSRKFKPQPRLSAAQAEAAAKSALNQPTALSNETSLWIVVRDSGPRTAWRVVVGASLLSPDQWECLIDAENGEVLLQSSMLRP